ncbi:hypothetical protein M514_08066 [Trichuris suis]|uniref:6-phosphogluconate dehydrogenase, decarboxylating n=1 Tax=Trichuris suis TaxID=68888 RepID=A0A085NUU3_9BILA|nr:hypothetical protein M513_08066 [Trichuris suis]KFD73239.1 hypothetical protein M514_08066 [Trichuris suis]
MMTGRADIAVVGLAVMGQNLILNMNDHGFTVCAFNRTLSKVDDFLKNEARGTKVIGAHSLQEMASLLKLPRRVMLMVKAGSAVDDFIDKLVPLLQAGDIIIDGGNSDFHDTRRRYFALKEKSIHYVGCGVSGGEEGARYGPSLMPGGAVEAWPHVGPILQSVAAKVDGTPCCQWVGSDGAGHYVKMVHNGIEYGDMQLISEAYHFLRDGLKVSHDQMAEVSIRTCYGILFRSNLHMQIVEAVFARCLSSMKDVRVQASGILPKEGVQCMQMGKEETASYTEHLRKALYASKIMSYAQGFMMLQAAAAKYNWEFNYGNIAMMWRGGCIIRSVFLHRIKEAFDRTPNLVSLLFNDFFRSAVDECQTSWRAVVSAAVLAGLPMPAFSSALAFFDGFRCPNLPANLLQALRDAFGAHTYERADNVGVYVHTDWTGQGGRIASSYYEV